jgi:hypothetical protein
MSYTLKLHGVTIGRSDLEHRDPPVGTAWGAFRRGAGYELVEPVFQLRTEDPERYRQARDALALELFDATGKMIETTSLDLEPLDGGLVLRAGIPDRTFWG